MYVKACFIIALLFAGPISCSTTDPALCGNTTSSNAEAIGCESNVCLEQSSQHLASESVAGGLLCVGPGGSDKCAATGSHLQQFSFSSNGATLHLRFKNDIVGNYSDESFNKSFHSGTVQLKLDVDGQQVSDYFNVESLDAEYVDGKLVFSIERAIGSVFYTVQSKDPSCRSDDILGYCGCYYDLNVLYTVDVALHVAQ